jgi:pyruvate dehydrogenase E1 component alpha subunit
MPYDQAVGNAAIADRAAGYGIPGKTIDGFNVFAVYEAVKEAVDRARRGDGPTLIEARFYRYVGHFVADDEGYRDASCNEMWERFDPVVRLAEYLVDAGLVDADWIAQADDSASTIVEDAIEFAMSAPEPEPESLYDGLYSEAFMQQQGIGL